jgi:hypothetical protein
MAIKIYGARRATVLEIMEVSIALRGSAHLHAVLAFSRPRACAVQATYSPFP